MKSKILNVFLIISSLFGFLEWGHNYSMFLFQAEAEIISKFFTNPISVLHPFTILPFVGQVLLLLTLFQKNPSKIMTYIGISGIGILFSLMFLIGCLSINFKIISSTIPFLTLGYYTFTYCRKLNVQRK